MRDRLPDARRLALGDEVRAVATGEIRLDLDPLDLLRALVGVSSVDSGPDWEASARRLVDILVAGTQVPREM